MAIKQSEKDAIIATFPYNTGFSFKQWHAAIHAAYDSLAKIPNRLTNTGCTVIG